MQRAELFLLGGGGCFLRADFLERAQYRLARNPEAREEVARGAGDVDDGDKKVFGRDKLVVQLGRHLGAALQRLHQLGGQVQLVARREYRTGDGALQTFEHGVGEQGQVNLEPLECGRDQRLLLQEERAEQVYGAYLVLSPLNRELVGPADGFFCFGGEVVEWRHMSLSSKYQVTSIRD